MKKINVVVQGLMYGNSGFATATRNIAYELSKHVNVKCFVLDDDNIDILKTKKGKTIRELSKKTITKTPIWITMTHPLGIAPNCGYSIGYAMFETEHFPPSYVQNLSKQDEVWTPSTFNVENMTRAGLGNVHLMPLGVDMKVFNFKKKPIRIGKTPGRNNFVFLSIMGWSARKGVDVMVRAFCEAFTANDGVTLYLKGGWYDEWAAKVEVENIKREFNNAPNIVVDFKTYNIRELPGLYSACDAFVLASRGEGWSLNCTEAMAMKKPLIATRWSAQLDYLNDENSYLIDLEKREPLKTCPEADWVCVEYHGQKFANPSIRSLRMQFRKVFEDRKAAKKKAQKAFRDVKKYTWEKSVERMLKRIKEIDKKMIKKKVKL